MFSNTSENNALSPVKQLAKRVLIVTFGSVIYSCQGFTSFPMFLHTIMHITVPIFLSFAVYTRKNSIFAPSVDFAQT